ncbi:uncharacterized protein ACRADG_011197 isoform 1-T1 [Cochliomyia hominivorax]
MNRVYVGNLPPDIRIKDIDDFFRPFGKLIYIDVNHRANSVYAYVQFDSARNAFNAVKARHGYDYEGYTLQMRLVENEVRKRRDATPPPPPPMFSEYGNRMDRNYTNSSMSSSFQSSSNSQWSNSNNRSNMQLQQQNMGYSSGGRSNMSQDNMINYSNRNNFNMQQPNGMEYSNNYSNRYNMNDYRNNSNWVVGNNGNDGSWNTGNSSWNNGNNNWNSGNNSWSSANNNWSGGNNSWNGGDTNNFNDVNNSWNNANNNMSNMNWNGGNNNVATNVYNPNNDPYTRPGFEDNFTRGLSGSGRKWFNRYIRRGFSPEMARAKALEHRTVPYTRDDPKTPMPDPNDPTNVALETIGNTIISLLSTANPVDNNQIMPAATNWCGPSTSNVNREDDGRNRITSKSQTKSLANHLYNKSLGILDKIKKDKSIKALSPSEKLIEHFHLKIINEYEELYMRSESSDENSIEDIHVPEKENLNKISQTEYVKTSEELLKEFNDLKLTLYQQVKPNHRSQDKKLSLESIKNRTLLVVQGGLREKEAKDLAILSPEILQKLLDIKKAYHIKREQEELQNSKEVMPKCLNLVPKPLNITINVNTNAKATSTLYSVGEETSQDLLKYFEYYKSALLLKAKQNKQQYNIKLSHEDEKRQEKLILQAGLKENEAKMLANVTQYSLQKLIDLKQKYELKKIAENSCKENSSLKTKKIVKNSCKETTSIKINKIAENSCKETTCDALWEEFIAKKEELLKLAKPDPKENVKKLSKEAKKTRKILVLAIDCLTENEASTLAVLELNKLRKLIELKKLYDQKTEKSEAKIKQTTNKEQTTKDKINSKTSPDLVEIEYPIEIIDLTEDPDDVDENQNNNLARELLITTNIGEEEKTMNIIMSDDDNNNFKEINTVTKKYYETKMELDTNILN